MHEHKYLHCISLGYFCGCAGSLQRHGLRCTAGPFDWMTSKLFSSVLAQIENDFVDYLKYENLYVIPEEPLQFKDKIYDFHYNHDVETNFENEYPSIYEKYMHRIERFRSQIKEPTLFVRVIYNQEEVQYINDNSEYINRVIKTANKDSDIIFVARKGIEISELNFTYFELSVTQYIGQFFELSTLFDNSDLLVDFLNRSVLMSQKERTENKKHFINSLTDGKLLSLSRVIGNCQLDAWLGQKYPNIKERKIFLFGELTLALSLRAI